MLDDLATAAVLAVVSFCYVGRLAPRFGVVGVRAVVSRMAQHPLSRLALLLPAILLLAWVSTVSRLGLNDARAVMTGGVTQRERDTCHTMQRRIWTQAQGSGCKLNIAEFGSCPLGGHYALDDQCRISCNRHGRDETMPAMNETKR